MVADCIENRSMKVQRELKENGVKLHEFEVDKLQNHLGLHVFIYGFLNVC